MNHYLWTKIYGLRRKSRYQHVDNKNTTVQHVDNKNTTVGYVNVFDTGLMRLYTRTVLFPGNDVTGCARGYGFDSGGNHPF